jgi:hypothetical protein
MTVHVARLEKKKANGNKILNLFYVGVMPKAPFVIAS